MRSSSGCAASHPAARSRRTARRRRAQLLASGARGGPRVPERPCLRPTGRARDGHRAGRARPRSSGMASRPGSRRRAGCGHGRAGARHAVFPLRPSRSGGSSRVRAYPPSRSARRRGGRTSLLPRWPRNRPSRREDLPPRSLEVAVSPSCPSARSSTLRGSPPPRKGAVASGSWTGHARLQRCRHAQEEFKASARASRARMRSGVHTASRPRFRRAGGASRVSADSSWGVDRLSTASGSLSSPGLGRRLRMLPEGRRCHPRAGPDRPSPQPVLPRRTSRHRSQPCRAPRREAWCGGAYIQPFRNTMIGTVLAMIMRSSAAERRRMYSRSSSTFFFTPSTSVS